MSIFGDNLLEDSGEGAASSFAAEPILAGERKMSVRNSLRADQLVDVLLVTRDTEIKDKVAEAFGEKNLFSLRVVNARVVQFQETIAEAEKPHLLILDLNTANLIDTEALERIKKVQYANIPVIVISSYLDQDTVRTLVQIKVDDWLPKDCSAHDIYKSCERVIRNPPAPKPQHDAQVLHLSACQRRRRLHYACHPDRVPARTQEPSLRPPASWTSISRTARLRTIWT